SYIVIGKSDSETMQKIKLFMAAYGIVDIKMRMLNIGELKRITGLPTGYVLYGSKSDQKKFIGNAVPTYTVKAMVEAFERNLPLVN
ncbi:MAG: DNA cytosine methyltransferase, partial [Leptospiraceae bacterium]|nr:DNA cytosine methyltransferase [Leptospiraceae bacterium]